MKSKVKPDQPWTVYGLREIGQSVVRYVGIAISFTKEKRLKTHIRQCNKKNSYKNNWIKSVLNKGGSLESVVIEEGFGESWIAREKHWIAWYRKIMGPLLTNVADGGEGAPGFRHTEEAKKKIGEASRSMKPESKQKKWDSNKGRTHTPEAKVRMREARRISEDNGTRAKSTRIYGPVSEETKQKQKASRRACLDKAMAETGSYYTEEYINKQKATAERKRQERLAAKQAEELLNSKPIEPKKGKMSRKGIKMSEEARKNMSDAAKTRWVEKPKSQEIMDRQIEKTKETWSRKRYLQAIPFLYEYAYGEPFPQ